MPRTRLLATALVLALAGCSGARDTTPQPEAESAKRTVGRIQFEPCARSGALAAQTLDGMCGTIKVPEDPAKPDGRKIGVITTSVRHHELGPVALALVKRNVPVDSRLIAGDTAAAQEVVVEP